jgi:hypothetical protein
MMSIRLCHAFSNAISGSGNSEGLAPRITSGVEGAASGGCGITCAVCGRGELDDAGS